MGIVAWPDGVYLGSTARCVICGSNVELAALSAGMVDVHGVQQFACNAHFANEHELFAGWADFALQQGRHLGHDAVKALCSREREDEPGLY